MGEGTTKRFEDIKAWQEARALVGIVYEAVKANKDFGSDFKFREQMQSAAVSIMSNVAEGFSRRSTKEFTQFLFVAQGSVAEVQSQFYVALDKGYISQEKFNELYSKSEEVARLVSGFIKYLLSKQRTLHKPQKLHELQELNKLGAGEMRSDVKA